MLLLLAVCLIVVEFLAFICIGFEIIINILVIGLVLLLLFPFMIFLVLLIYSIIGALMGRGLER